MYRLIVESLLGLDRAGDKLTVTPHLPSGWDGFTLHYRYLSADYAIEVTAGTAALMTVDGQKVENNVIGLVDDGRKHLVNLTVVGG